MSLLPTGYKLYAAILLGRLRDAGSESRIWKTQFGFRSGRGTTDALFLIRRLMDNALATKHDGLVLLAMDLAKAFDSVSPEALLQALRRFGIPDCFVDAVAAMYSNRTFCIRDCGATSESFPQHFGISQGCPLSPFLFAIVMTVLLHDTATQLQQAFPDSQSGLHVDELVYADDTLLVGVSSDHVQAYMECIEAAGKNYGLAFNWRKLGSLSIGCGNPVYKPDGT